MSGEVREVPIPPAGDAFVASSTGGPRPDGDERWARQLAYNVKDLKKTGSSLAMNWGEDTGCWEVEWITGGVRFTAVGLDLPQTLAACRSKAYTYYGRAE